MFLLVFTQIVNFIVLAISLWLGLFIVTRSPRRIIAWLTALALWSVATLPINVLLTLNPLPTPIQHPAWWQTISNFWQASGLERALSSWLRGGSLTPTIIFWHHVSVLIRSGPLTQWRVLRIWFGYGLIVVAMLFQAYTPFLFTLHKSDPLYLNRLETGPLYPLFLGFLLVYASMSFVNLLRSAQEASITPLSRQFTTLAGATLVAAFILPLIMLGRLLQLSVPIVVISLMLGGTVIVIGYGVANYSAVIAGRTIRTDFMENGVVMALIALFYAVIAWGSINIYNLPAATLVVILVLVIISHSLVDAFRRRREQIRYLQTARQFRRHLQPTFKLNGEDDIPVNLPELLSPILNSLTQFVSATYGLILLFEEEMVELIVAHNWSNQPITLSVQQLITDDVIHLPPGHFPFPLKEAALLIPLYSDNIQLGVLLLGRPVNGIRYARADVERLLYPTDRLADLLGATQREAEFLSQVKELVETDVIEVEETPLPKVEISLKVVEKALRKMNSYTYLGDTPLANLTLVTNQLAPDEVTHVDRGKAVYNILVEAIEKLCPDADKPESIPGREWYQYLILYKSYVEDELNRDIMSYLYISEGTFNRNRRAALRAVTRALEEMELAARM